MGSKKSCIHTNSKVQKILRPDYGRQISVDYLCKQMWSFRGVRGEISRFLYPACEVELTVLLLTAQRTVVNRKFMGIVCVLS